MNKAWPLPVILALAMASGCGQDSTPSAVSGAAPGSISRGSTGQGAKTVPSNLSPQTLAAQADVPVYPGALFPDKMTQAPKRDEAGKMHTYLVMRTADTPDKVVAFYLKASKYSELKTKDGSELQGMSPKGNLVLIDITQAGGMTLINVKSVQGS